MMHNNKLAITIPTYNRHNILFENLMFIMPEIIQHSIPIYISDDSSDDKTGEMISGLVKVHPYIYYYKNAPYLGHDRNILRALSLPDTVYVWLMGDSVIINRHSISKLLSKLSGDYDFIFVNSYVNSAINTSQIQDIYFFHKFTWYLTLTGATIYNSCVIKYYLSKVPIRYYNNFQQLSIILDYLPNRIKAYWINEKLISINVNKKSYWMSNVITIFVKDWIDLIKSFPLVFKTESEINEVVYSHALNAELFTFRKLLRYRLSGGLTLKTIALNYRSIKIATRESIIYLIIIAIIPRWMLSICTSVRKMH
jgi:hypothetical protein